MTSALFPPKLAMAAPWLVGLLTIHFSDTVQLGTILTTALVIILAGVFTIRAKTAEVWRENYDAERVAREHAEKANQDKDAAITQLQTKIAVLEARPTVDQLNEMLSKAMAQTSEEHGRIVNLLHDLTVVVQSIGEKVK